MQDAWASRVLEANRRKGLHNAKVILGHGTEESPKFLAHFDHVQELAPCYLEEGKSKGVSGKSWFAIPNFVDCERFKPGDRQAARKRFDLPENAFVVLDVAAFKRTHKRLDWLAHEVAKTKAQNRKSKVLLVVAGAQTSETDALLPVMREALGDRLHVLTELCRDDMPELYRTADVFAHASLQEMMPIALIEALASGLPVIANRAPIFEWIIGEAGTLVDASSPHALADALTPYLLPSFRAEKSAAARQRAVAMFSANVVVEQILRMYETVFAHASPAEATKL
jgi:glycosyltransferase involved in cell wall biosynthesis